jgi:hypothetical protein
VSLKDHEEAKKWYKADRPVASRQYMYGPQITTFYTRWLKWNPTSKGGISHRYKGYLVRKREESEAGAAM